MQELEDLQLRGADLGLEDLDDLPCAQKVVALDTAEDLEDPRRARERAVVTDTLEVPGSGSVRVCAVAPLLADAIGRLHGGQALEGLLLQS